MFNYLKNIELKENLIIISEFNDGKVTSYDLKKIFSEYPIFKELLSDNSLYNRGHLPPDGSGIIWNDDIDIAAEELYYNGTLINTKDVLDIRIVVGNMISKARTEKHMSQTELSRITKIHQADISNIERGITNPSVKTLDRIAKGLGLNLRLFLE